jgi:3-oxoacyl-[acyl-carrier-protein] synthase-3
MRSRIVGTGGYLPSRTVANAELAALIGEDPETIARRSGVELRHFADESETTSDLALNASIEALRAAGCRAYDLDCIVLATQTPEYCFPGSGCVLGAKLGLVGVPALDVRNQCTGFLYGLAVADHFVRAGTYRRVLVVAAEVMSSMLDFSPRGREAAALYGDGAGAVVLAAEDDDARGVLAHRLHADGRFARSAMRAAPPARRWGASRDRDPEAALRVPIAVGAEVAEEARRHVREAIEEALHVSELAPEDVSVFIAAHDVAPPGTTVAEDIPALAARRRSGVRLQGNVAGAALPLALDAEVRAHRVAPGDVVLLCAFGSGFTWAWTVIRW